MWNVYGSKRYTGNWICDYFLCPGALNLKLGSLSSSTLMWNASSSFWDLLARLGIGNLISIAFYFQSNGLPDPSFYNYHMIKGPHYQVIQIFLFLAIFLEAFFDLLILILF